MHAGVSLRFYWRCTSVRVAICAAGLATLVAGILVEPVVGQERSLKKREESAETQSEKVVAADGDYVDIFVTVPNIVIAGKILREVGVAKAQEGIPPGDAEPRFDAEHNKLYFHTTAAHVATMRKILLKIEAGAAAPGKAVETVADVKPAVRGTARMYAIELWLVQMQLPKGEVVELGGPRGEMLTMLGGLEKESKAEVLNHIYLTAEERKSAQSMLSESVPIVNSLASGGGGFGRREVAGPGGGNPGGPGISSGGPGESGSGSRPVMASLSRESLGTQFKVTVQGAEGQNILLDYTVSKSFLGKQEEGTLIPTDSAGGGIRQPGRRLFEIESAVRAPLGNVLTASSQMRGGEKPTEIRVLILVNPL